MSTEVNVGNITPQRDTSKDIQTMLEISIHERESIKAQMYDATKRIQELDGVIAALQRTVDLIKEQANGTGN